METGFIVLIIIVIAGVIYWKIRKNKKGSPGGSSNETPPKQH